MRKIGILLCVSIFLLGMTLTAMDHSPAEAATTVGLSQECSPGDPQCGGDEPNDPPGSPQAPSGNPSFPVIKRNGNGPQNNTSNPYFIPVTGSGLASLSCGVDNHFLMKDGTRVSIPSFICGLKSNLQVVTKDSMPAPLPAGLEFIRGISVTITLNGAALDTLPAEDKMKISFTSFGASLDRSRWVILHWEESLGWQEISVEKLDLLTNPTGVYILAQRV